MFLILRVCVRVGGGGGVGVDVGGGESILVVVLVAGQLVEVHARQVHGGGAVAGVGVGVAFTRQVDDLLQPFLDGFEAGLEIWGAALLEGQLELDGRSAVHVPAGHGLDERGPGVGAEPGHHQVRVVEVQERAGEGNELGRVGRDAAVGSWEVDQPLIGEVDRAIRGRDGQVGRVGRVCRFGGGEGEGSARAGGEECSFIGERDERPCWCRSLWEHDPIQSHFLFRLADGRARSAGWLAGWLGRRVMIFLGRLCFVESHPLVDRYGL